MNKSTVQKRAEQLLHQHYDNESIIIRQYWGGEAIALRLGHRPGSKGKIKEWIKRYGVPAYLRRKPGRYCTITWYSSESLMLAWELQRVAHYRNWLESQAESSKASKESVQW